MNPSEYETMFRVEDAHWWYRSLRALIRTALDAHAGTGRLLDIGCGTGANLAMLGEDFEATGVDYSPDALRNCALRGLNRVAQANALALPFASESFDLALMIDLLYHRDVSDKHAALAESARVLRPGGVLLVNVPAYEWLRSSHDEAIQTGHRFTRGEVVTLLESSGLEPLRVTYWNAALFPAIAFLRLWRRFSPHPGSDLEGYKDGFATKVLGGVLGLERTLLQFVDLPVGLSILAVARRPEG